MWFRVQSSRVGLYHVCVCIFVFLLFRYIFVKSTAASLFRRYVRGDTTIGAAGVNFPRECVGGQQCRQCFFFLSLSSCGGEGCVWPCHGEQP